MGAVCVCADQSNKAQVVEPVATQRLPEEKPPLQLQEPPQEKEPQLIVTIVGARGLRDANWLPGTGKPDCYCELKTGGLMLHATPCIPDSCEPTWGTECKVMDIATGSPLTFTVFDKDLNGADMVGKVTLQSKEYLNGFNGELKLQDAQVSQAFVRVKVKVAGKPLPPAEPAEVTVIVDRPTLDISFGLDLDPRDGNTLHVMEMRGGPFTDYNSEASPNLQLKLGDAVMRVNSITGSKQMIDEFKNKLRVECNVKRTVLTTVIFDRGPPSESPDPLGLKFPEDLQGEALVVTGLTEGAAAKHNRSAKPADMFYVGDRILSVGCVKGSAALLKQQLDKQQDGKIQLVVRRVAAALPETEGSNGFIHWVYA